MITVIIPTYNGEKVIGRAIQSVLDQQGEWMFEILVCDDCSTDKTVQIATGFPFVKVLMNSVHTGGPNAGRNAGIKAAKSSFIAFLDQDDEWLPDKINKQIEVIDEGFDVVSSPKVTVHR